MEEDEYNVYLEDDTTEDNNSVGDNISENNDTSEENLLETEEIEQETESSNNSTNDSTNITIFTLDTEQFEILETDLKVLCNINLISIALILSLIIYLFLSKLMERRKV